MQIVGRSSSLFTRVPLFRCRFAQREFAER